MPRAKNKRIDTEQLVEYLELYQKAYPGCSPTFRELSDVFQISTSRVSSLLDALETAGKITFVLGRDTARSISVPDGIFLTRQDIEQLGLAWGEVVVLQTQAKQRLAKF